MRRKKSVNRWDKAFASLAAPVLSDLATARLFFLSICGLAAAALPQLLERGKLSGHTLGSYSALWLILLGASLLLALAGLALLVIAWSGAREPFTRLALSLRQYLAKRRFLAVLGALAAWLIYVLIVLYRYQRQFVDFVPQVWLFFLFAGAGAFFITALWRKTTYFWALLFTVVVYGAGVKALGYLPDISAYPFSLSWSEGSRYYYASLPYSRALYGTQFPLSFLHPSRYLLQSMAFLAPEAGIYFHRLWQVVLWLALSFLTGLVLARYFKTDRLLIKLAGAAWAALFVLQGPVYYHLLVCVILVLWGFDRDRFWKTLVFVLLASIWAGISRVNWIPVPAMLAATLYLLEKPFCASRPAGQVAQGWLAGAARYFWPPLVWGGAGVAAAIAAQAAYVPLSGHQDASSFGTSFQSALLWYRLFPSPTYELGVLPAILLVSAPLLILIGGNWLHGREHWHPLRVLGITVMAGMLFVGGLVVSTKIGGGSNIHNLDAYLAILLVVGGMIGMGNFGSETGGWARVWRPAPLMLALVLVPVIWNLNIGDPFVKRDFVQAAYDLNKLNNSVQEFAGKGEVLFITQRQLEVFHLVPDVRVVPDYELMTLTEMSISNNQAYLDHFYQDLQDHRFALIVADRQESTIKDPRKDAFAEENNAWVNNVSTYIQKYYQEELFFDTQGIQLLVPKP